MTVNISRTKTI